MYLFLKHEIEYKAPAEYILDADLDWTHFTHLHKKSHKLFMLLAKTPDYSVFLYRTRYVSFLPFSTGFVVFREYLPESEGYRQVYIPVNGGNPNVLESTHIRHEEKGTITSSAKFYFWLNWYWRLVPSLFCNLLRMRMIKVWNEDFSMIKERIAKQSTTNQACSTPLPDLFRFDRVFLKEMPEAQVAFYGKMYKDFYNEKLSFKTKIRPQT